MDIIKLAGMPAVRSAQEIRDSLLKRAFAENRGEEMAEKIAARVRRAAEMSEEHKAGLELARHWDEACGDSQSLRKLSLRAHEAGMSTTFYDSTLKTYPGSGRMMALSPAIN